MLPERRSTVVHSLAADDCAGFFPGHDVLARPGIARWANGTCVLAGHLVTERGVS